MAAMTQPVNFSGATPVNPTSYTSAPDTRPAAASNWSVVIYNSTTGKHQVSDGTQWLDLALNPYAAPQGVPSYAPGSEPLASANSGNFAKIGTSYYRSNGTVWQLLGTDIYEALCTFAGVRTNKGLAQAVPLTRRVPTNTIYIDPVGGNNANNGSTPALAKQSLPSLAASTAYLFKSGTTVPGFTVGVNGTNATTGSIVFGVYDPTTGTRYTGRVCGLVNVSGQVDIGGRSFVSVENLNVQGGNPRISADNSTSCQVICCKANGNSAGVGIKQYLGAGNTGKIEIDGCEAQNNQTGVEIASNPDSIVVTGSLIQLCELHYNWNGIKWGGGDRRWENCHIANNTLTNNFRGVVNQNENNTQIIITGHMRNGSSIRWNTVTDGSYSNLWIQYNGSSATDYGGLLIENNLMEYAGYNINFFNNVSGGSENNPVLIQYNRLRYAGGKRDGTPANINNEYWGRNIELFSVDGVPESEWCKYVVMRWNDVSYAYLFERYGTEGIGLGFDDRVKWCTAYGNIAVRCEGQGAQTNNDKYNRMFANVLIDNMKVPRIDTGWTFDGVTSKNIAPFPGARPQQLAVESADLVVFGDTNLQFSNAVVSGRGGLQNFSAFSNGSQVESPPGTFTPTCRVHNNLLVNGREAGLMYGAAITHSNTYVRTPKAKVVRTEINGWDNNGAGLALSAGETLLSGAAIDDAFAQADACSLTLFQSIPFAGTVGVPPVDPGGGGGGTPGTVRPTIGADYWNLANGSAEVPMPAAVNGDTQILAVLTRPKATTVNTPAGYTLIGSGVPHDNADAKLTVFRKNVVGTVGATTVTVSFGGTVMVIGAGTTLTGTFLTHQFGPTNIDWIDTWTVPSVTATVDGSLWLQIGAVTQSPRSFAQTSATEFHERFIDNGSVGISLAMAYRDVNAGATGTETWTTADPYGGSGYERPLTLSIILSPKTGNVTPPLPPAKRRKPFRPIFQDFEV